MALLLVPGHAASTNAADPSVSRSSQATGGITGRVQNVVTGQYLNNARVSIRGTTLVTYTDYYGIYRFSAVPSGNVTLEVFYTGLDPVLAPVQIREGEVVEHDVSLTSVARYGSDPNTIRLNSFVVSESKDMDVDTIAVNEQRFAANIKNVMAADAVGDVMGGQVGDFLKFIPGLTGEYANGEIVGISIRGVGSDLTNFTADGAPRVSPAFAGGRGFHTAGLSLNDISRVEVTKVPLPSTPADSLSGSVNMISKSAFERSHRQLRYNLGTAAYAREFTFSKQPSVHGDTKERRMYPWIDFDYTLPITKNFGVVVTGMLNERYYFDGTGRLLNYAGNVAGATPDRPYLQSVQLLQNANVQKRNTLGFKADWRFLRDSVLSANIQINHYANYLAPQSMTFNAGNNATPTVAGGQALGYGSDYVHGAMGRGAVTMSASGTTWKGDGRAGGLNYRFDDGRWKITASLNSSETLIRYVEDPGLIAALSAVNPNPVRVNFYDIGRNGPERIEVLENNGQVMDLHSIDSYRINSTVSTSRTRVMAKVQSANLDVQRSFDWFVFPFSVQAGGARRIQTQDRTAVSSQWTHNGPDGVAATLESATPYLARNPIQSPLAPLGGPMPWISATRAWKAFQANPILFSATPAQVVAMERSWIANSKLIEETVDATYLQASALWLENRLKLVGGVRYEKTLAEGVGPLIDPNAVWLRNPDGSFARNANGTRIRRPEAGASGSMEQLRLTDLERAARTEKSFDGYFPSLHLTYEVKENLYVRAAYAKTYGRPGFLDLIPHTTQNQADIPEEQFDDPTVIRGTLTVSNPALRPWSADNYDLSLEYYTQQGGMFSAGVFLKEIADFFGDDVRIATQTDLDELGLDQRYLGWRLQTKFNSGDARITGVELNLRHSLAPLGPWGRYFTVFANGTKLKLEGSRQASFSTFVPESASWGVTFNRKRIMVGARWNYRGQIKSAAYPALGPDAFGYTAARLMLDLNLSYRLSSRLSLVVNVNNLTGSPDRYFRYGPQTPDYARYYRKHSAAAQMIGIRLSGTW